MKDYLIYICPKCKNQLEKAYMGKRCPHCQEWQYHHHAEKLVLGYGDAQKKQPEVFIERAALCTIEGIRALCGTDEEYAEYVKKLTHKSKEKNK